MGRAFIQTLWTKFQSKLTMAPVYLYIRARGELPRLVAAQGDVQYEDKRITFDEFFNTYRGLAPFGQVSYLEVDGKQFSQKLAITKYFAKQGGLWPSFPSPVEEMGHDSAWGVIEDVLETTCLMNAGRKFRGLSEEESIGKLKNEVYPKKVPYFEKILKEVGTGFYYGSKLSAIDLHAFDVVEHVVDLMGLEWLSSFPLVKKHFQMVGDLPKIKAYVSGRPEPDRGFKF